MGGQIHMSAAEFREAVLKQEPSERKEGGASGKHAAEAPPLEVPKPTTITLDRSKVKRMIAAALILLAIGFGIGSDSDPASEAKLSRLEARIEQLSQELDGQ